MMHSKIGGINPSDAKLRHVEIGNGIHKLLKSWLIKPEQVSLFFELDFASDFSL